MKMKKSCTEAKKNKLEVETKDGAHLEKLIREIYTTPKAIVDQVGKLIQ